MFPGKKPFFRNNASLWKTGKNSAKTGFMTSAQVSLSTDMEYMARSLCDGSWGCEVSTFTKTVKKKVSTHHTQVQPSGQKVLPEMRVPPAGKQSALATPQPAWTRAWPAPRWVAPPRTWPTSLAPPPVPSGSPIWRWTMRGRRLVLVWKFISEKASKWGQFGIFNFEMKYNWSG